MPPSASTTCSSISSLAPILLVCAILLQAPGCSLFDPREPEDPGEVQDPTQPPTSPSMVMYNLDLALEARSITIYSACLDTSFVFTADPADAVEYGGSPWNYDFDAWDYDAEFTSVYNLLASTSGDSLPEDSLVVAYFSLVPGYSDPPAPMDSAVIWREYSIVVAGSEHAGWENPAVGQARITMVEDASSYWYISRWEDFRLEEYPEGACTWGVAKAPYR